MQQGRDIQFADATQGEAYFLCVFHNRYSALKNKNTIFFQANPKGTHGNYLSFCLISVPELVQKTSVIVRTSMSFVPFVPGEFENFTELIFPNSFASTCFIESSFSFMSLCLFKHMYFGSYCKIIIF